MNLKAVLEGLLFVCGDEGLSQEDIMDTLEIKEQEATYLLEQLKEDYQKQDRGIELTTLGNHFKLVTKKEHKEYIQKWLNLSDDDTLSEASLEVLAIIAYNQPLTRAMIDEIRGISSSYIVRKLSYKGLIEEVGRSESAGRPILYGTTDLFMDYFGLKSLHELPPIEIKEEKNDVQDLYHSKYQENE